MHGRDTLILLNHSLDATKRQCEVWHLLIYRKSGFGNGPSCGSDPLEITHHRYHGHITVRGPRVRATNQHKDAWMDARLWDLRRSQQGSWVHLLSELPKSTTELVSPGADPYCLTANARYRSESQTSLDAIHTGRLRSTSQATRAFARSRTSPASPSGSCGSPPR
jgi:hypothetical protein